MAPDQYKTSRSVFWRELFELRPDLAPPGYEETLKRMGYWDRHQAMEELEECDIEF